MVSSSSSSSSSGAEVRIPPPLVFVSALVVGIVLGRIQAADVPIDRALRIGLGAIACVLGVALVLSARLHFLRTKQHPAPWKPSPELILVGPYRLTRNPMYVGITTFLIGLGVALGDLWISAAAPLALLAVHFIAVLPEERYLIQKFGAPYEEYLRKVRRYV